MNYIQEENTNLAKICGLISKEPKFSHQVENENFFEFEVEVERLSKIKDVIPVTISERTLVGKSLKIGDFVEILGEYRSYNKLFNEKSKLMLHLFAKELSMSEGEFVNEVKLVGFVCKEPVYRKTPFDREICDVLLAINRPNYHKSDYVPCIMWGRNARFMSNQKIGCKVEIVGRIQSRQYLKTNEKGEEESKVAYEVSCQRIGLLSNVSNVVESKDETKIV
ncbi:MAG: single-stranded DNA-binding protein [Clostridiales bacterium]|nr:single-stranded DNA-binding protein [Clostridiales bacterium]